MTRLFLKIIGTLILAGNFAYAETECAVPNDKILESILRVVGESHEGNLVQGSAVVVAKNRVITAAHVIDDLNYLTIKSNGQSRHAKVIFTATEHDIALLEVDTTGLSPIPFSPKLLESNDQVWAIGYPLGGNLTSSEGAFVDNLNNYKLHTTAEVNHGQSGGGLVTCNDGNYLLSGMIISYGAVLRDGEYVRLTNYSVAVSTNEVSSLIKIMEPGFALTLAD